MYTLEEDYQCMLNKLNTIREQKNMSKYALAKAASMSSSRMSDLLNGKSKPYLYNMLLICNALQITLGELFEKENINYEDEEWISVLTGSCRRRSNECCGFMRRCCYGMTEKCRG